MVPHSITIKMKIGLIKIFRVTNGWPWPYVFPMSNWIHNIRNSHPLQHFDVNTSAFPVDILVVDNVAYIVEMNPGFEIVFLCPHDLADDELEENCTGCPTDITLVNVINPSITIASTVGWASTVGSMIKNCDVTIARENRIGRVTKTRCVQEQED